MPTPRTRIQPPRYHTMTPQEVRIATSNLFYKSQAITREREAGGNARLQACRMLNNHLSYVEMMLCAAAQDYAYQAYDLMREQGLLRHRLKQHANTLRDTTRTMMKRCNDTSTSVTRESCLVTFAPLSEEYMATGASFLAHLQVTFMRNLRQTLHVALYSTKNAIDHARQPHSDIIARLQMVCMVMTCHREYAAMIRRKADGIADGYFKIDHRPSNFPDKLMCAAQDSMRILLGEENPQLPEGLKEVQDARQAARNFNHETSTRAQEWVEAALSLLMTDYIEYVVARLRIYLQRGHLPLPIIRALVMRLGTVENVRRLLTDIRQQIPWPIQGVPLLTSYDETDDADTALDLSRWILEQPATESDCDTEAALTQFRRLSLEDHVLLPPKEDERVVRCRELRQEARRNSGTLPFGTLRQLYKELRTKKALCALLREAGLEGTARDVEKMRVKELRELKGPDYAISA